jgi:peptide/nickel transport system permease protein
VGDELEVKDAATETYMHTVLRRLRRNRMGMLGLAMIVVIVAAVALAGPLSLGEDPYYMLSPADLHSGQTTPEFMAPNSDHILGTDELGRDAWSRLLYGGRVSLLIGVIASLTSIAIGTFVGLISGFFGGWFDNLLMRLTDTMMSIPTLPLMVVLSAVLKGSVFNLVLILVVFGWMGNARMVRGVTLVLREQEYVEAARAIGASPWRIMFRHLLPNTAAPIIVSFSMSISILIIYEASLSYLGLGIPQPTPSWGNMLYNAQNYIFSAPQLVWFPGLAIFLTSLGFNFFGDGLRDALDPKLKL